MDLELLDDDVADLLRDLGVGRLVLLVVQLVVRGGDGESGDHGPDKVRGGGDERAAGDADEEHDDDVPGALLGPGGRRLGGARELGAADLDVGGDGVEVVVVAAAVAVAVVEVRAKAADAEHGDDRGDVGDAGVVVDGAAAAAAAGIGVGREGDGEGAARPRVGGEDVRGGDDEQQGEAVGGHGGRAAATERLMCVWGKGRRWGSEKMELGVDCALQSGCEGNPREACCFRRHSVRFAPLGTYDRWGPSTQNVHLTLVSLNNTYR